MKNIILFCLLIFTCSLFAQKESDLSKKLNDIKGEAEKIIIQTDAGEFYFTGDEAKELLYKIKSEKKLNVFSFKDTDNDFVWNDGESDEDFDVEFLNEDGDESITKKITVTLKDGEKRVVVKTEENGEEKIDIYEGEDAEKFLEEQDDEDKDLKIKINSDDNSENKIIIMKKKIDKKNTE